METNNHNDSFLEQMFGKTPSGPPPGVPVTSPIPQQQPATVGYFPTQKAEVKKHTPGVGFVAWLVLLLFTGLLVAQTMALANEKKLEHKRAQNASEAYNKLVQETQSKYKAAIIAFDGLQTLCSGGNYYACEIEKDAGAAIGVKLVYAPDKQ